MEIDGPRYLFGRFMGPYLVHAACCISNFLIHVGDSFEPEEESSDEENVVDNEPEQAEDQPPPAFTYATATREELAKYLCLTH
ncbi:hypothetical protein R1flu_004101 [Riccia fluitans]|uniref:Uncharacterized protein n=1 Tax=Riccia fluitans TaxID=41844 RepID=A0ABD1YSC5_9MARC